MQVAGSEAGGAERVGPAFHGDVLQETVTGKSAKAIQAFNEFVANDTSTQQVMLTVRDGLTLIRKK